MWPDDRHLPTDDLTDDDEGDTDNEDDEDKLGYIWHPRNPAPSSVSS